MSSIGVFDSGVGGLSVWQEIARQLSSVPLIYLADQAHVPYGTRPISQIRDLSTAITRFLLAQGARLIVVACNTASAAALYHLRETFPDVPFVGMEPAIKPAVETSRTGIIGVIATPATFQGELFASLLDRYATGAQVLTQVCPGLVEAVETGELDSPATETRLRDCLAPLMVAGIDTLVLGCTHYPFLALAIARVVGPEVRIIDPAPAVARQTVRLFRERLCPPVRPAQHVFFTSGAPTALARSLSALLDLRSPDVRPVVWQAGRLQAG
jgi:glutamate racemase